MPAHLQRQEANIGQSLENHWSASLANLTTKQRYPQSLVRSKRTDQHLRLCSVSTMAHEHVCVLSHTQKTNLSLNETPAHSPSLTHIRQNTHTQILTISDLNCNSKQSFLLSSAKPLHTCLFLLNRLIRKFSVMRQKTTSLKIVQ